MSNKLYIGNCLTVMVGEIVPESVDCVITDPPYHLTSIVERFGKDGSAAPKGDVYRRQARGFMSSLWDGGDISFDPDTWATVAHCMKPGAYLAAFGGTRTYHRMAMAIEDGGFVIRDMMNWLYGSGFPKSRNAGWGRGTGLKPAHEPICLAQKPKEGSYDENFDKWETGYMNINSARVPLQDGDSVQETISGALNWAPGSSVKGSKKLGKRGGEKPWKAKNPDKPRDSLVGSKGYLSTNTEGNPLGRWPANVVHDGSEEVLSQLPDGVARFWYCAKPSTREREEGLDDLPSVPAHVIQGRNDTERWNQPAAGMRGGGMNPHRTKEAYGSRCGRESTLAHGENTERKNSHATVKPIALMRWLIRLLAPPGGIVLDPFLGSGTTAIAAHLEGRDWIGIERDENYARIAEHRIRHWMKKEGS